MCCCWVVTQTPMQVRHLPRFLLQCGAKTQKLTSQCARCWQQHHTGPLVGNPLGAKMRPRPADHPVTPACCCCCFLRHAAIVGGLVGALWGASAIPPFMTGPVLKFEGRGGPTRPSFLHTRHLPGLFEGLWQAADVDMMMID
jgi:hypothetical protein